MTHNSTNPSASARDDNADLMGDEVTDEEREDLQSSLAEDNEGMFDPT